MLPGILKLTATTRLLGTAARAVPNIGNAWHSVIGLSRPGRCCATAPFPITWTDDNDPELGSEVPDFPPETGRSESARATAIRGDSSSPIRRVLLDRPTT